MEENYKEYATFFVKTKDGTEVEMAVVDEFEFEKKQYVVGALIKDDEIIDEGRYIYRAKVNGDEFTVEKITREFEYNRIAEVYMEMVEE